MSGPAIEATDLGKRFGDFTAVAGVSFSVAPGEIFGYLGANGAGKSTTIRMLCGLLPPTSGRAVVAGEDVARHPERVKARLGYMSQKFSLYLDLPVWENVRFFGGAYGLDRGTLARRGQSLLEETGLWEQRGERTGDLPGGLRQRLALACALLHRPQVVFLDEPTAGVDPGARRVFWRLIRRLSAQGTTVFVTTHYLDEAEYCDRIGLMVDGRLVALDTPAALKRRWVPEDVVLLHGEELERATGPLRALPGVRAVVPFGAGLHVRVERGSDPADLAATARRAGARGVEVTPTEATLEDVFLAVVDRGAAPEPEAAR